MPKLSLEKLIQSLSQGELRAFSLTIKKDKNPSYYNLFNAIRSGKSDESKKKNNNETQLRNYLYNSILESLVKSSKTIDTQIVKGLHYAEVLYNRQLIKEASKEIEKIEKLATKHERFGYIIQILEWKKIIGIRLETFSTSDYRAASALEKQTIDNYLNYLKAADIYTELLFRKKKEGYVQEQKKLPKLSEIELTKDDDAIPRRTLYYKRMAHAVHNCLIQDTQSQYELTKLIVQDAAVIIETNDCLSAYFEHLTSCICVGAFNEFFATLNKLKADIKRGKFGNNQDLRIKLFYYASNYELIALTYMGDENNLKLKIKEVELGIQKLGDSLSLEMLLIIYWALKLAYYFTGNTAMSKHYLNKIKTHGGPNLRSDVYQSTLFFNLLISTDSNNVTDMETTLTTIENECDLVDKPQYEFDLALLKVFQDFAADKLNKEELYNKVLIAYNEHITPISSGFKYTENNYLFYLWAKARLNKKPYMEIASQVYETNFKY